MIFMMNFMMIFMMFFMMIFMMILQLIKHRKDADFHNQPQRLPEIGSLILFQFVFTALKCL